MQSDPEHLQVTAYDPDGDNLYFTWTIPHNVGHEVLPLSQNGDLSTSVVSISRDSLLDAEIVYCAVSDLISGSTVFVTWEMEVE